METTGPPPGPEASANSAGVGASSATDPVPTQTVSVVARGGVEAMDAFARTVRTIMSDLNALSDKGASTFLLVFGGMLAIVALAFKLDVAGLARIGALESSEFLALLAFSAALIVLGTTVRLYHQRSKQRLSSRAEDHASRLASEALARTHDVVAQGISAQVAIHKQATERPDAAPRDESDGLG